MRAGAERPSAAQVKARNIDALMGLGGFIGELAEDMFFENENPVIIKIAARNCVSGPGISTVSMELRRIMTEVISKYDTFVSRSYAPGENPGYRSRKDLVDGFANWFFDAAAKLAVADSKKERTIFWSTWKADRELRKVLKKLCPLEERILCQRYGIETGDNKLTEKEAAAVSAINEEPEFVRIVLQKIETELKCGGSSIEAFEETFRRTIS